MEKRRFPVKFTLHVLFALLFITVCAWIKIPVSDIPITLQVFAALVLLRLMPAREFFVTYLLYLVLGLLGVPVFAGMQGGPGVFAGPTGGYLLGFIPGAILFILIDGCRFKSNTPGIHELAVFGNIILYRVKILLAMVLFVFVSYVCGTLWYMNVYSGGIGLTFSEAFAICGVPYIIADIIKIISAYAVSHGIWFWLNIVKYTFNNDD